ncbi:CPBP family intramembrane glutamic endopeptidase [Haloimpatiens sp. FM7330]|uniref:CPBP family intramembrane glutamic endopeptidase n=1 Tax=Haloimpatiens sp. FM7330 TaxID=3298610 RepID=UPI00362EEDB7
MFSNNKGLFKEAKAARYLPNFILAPILVIVFFILGEIPGELLNSFIISSNVSPSIAMLSNLICGFLFVSLIIFIWVRFVEKRKVSSMGFYKESFIKKFFTGFLIGLIMFSLVTALLFVTGHITINNNPTSAVGLSALSSILIVLPGWIIQSATEEIATRGWLMNVLGARYNVFLGLLISSTLFGILHLANPNVSVVAILNIILVGIFFGFYVIKTKNLWGACGLHAAWNWAQGNIFGFEVSGLKIQIGSLIHLKLKGADWFTGGAFGPEAGIAATIVLLTGIIIVFFMLRKDN